VNKRRKNPFNIELPDSDLWVFGYGSLMWDPGFAYCKAIPGRIYGFNRRLCLWSTQYRGSPEQPGLVAGLAPGGSCRGLAFLLADNDHTSVFEYLYDREMISDAYRPVVKPVHLGHGDTVSALTFVSRRDHRQYAPKMNTRETVSIIRAAQGPKGSNTDYILNTVQHLDEMGILKTELHNIASQL
jgi:cation transport protein ChaC